MWAALSPLAGVCTIACLKVWRLLLRPLKWALVPSLVPSLRVSFICTPEVPLMSRQTGPPPSSHAPTPRTTSRSPLLWLLALFHETPVLDGLRTLGAISGAAASLAVLLSRGAASPPALFFRPWAVLSRMAVGMCLAAALRLLLVARFTQRRAQPCAVMRNSGAPCRGFQAARTAMVALGGVDAPGTGRCGTWRRQGHGERQQGCARSREGVGAGVLGWGQEPLSSRQQSRGWERSVHEAAAQAVQSTSSMGYASLVQSAQVHIRLRGLQPEQLRPGWQENLAELMAAQGWSLLSSSVRRGSILISFTLASTRSVRSASSEAAARAPGTGAGCGSGPAGVACASGVVAADGEAAGVLPGPGEFLTKLGLATEDLPAGFTFTMQAVVDGRWHRVKYLLQPEGSWAEELLAPGALLSDSNGTPPYQSLAGAAQTLVGPHGPAAGDCGGADTAAASGGAAAAEGSASAAGRAAPWSMDAPLVLVGRKEAPTSGSGSGSGAGGSGFTGANTDDVDGASSSVALNFYEATVQAWPKPRSRDAGGRPSLASSDAGASGLVFRVRPLGLGGEAANLEVEQALLLSPGCCDADGGMSDDVASAAAAVGLADAEGDWSFATRSSFEEEEGGHSGGRGRTHVWALTLREGPTPPAPAAAAAAAEPPTALSFGESCLRSPQAPLGVSASPFLVDLSLWQGHELLATRVMMLVPNAASSGYEDGGGSRGGGGSGGPTRGSDPWVGELRELLRMQHPDAAQSALFDFGLFLSGSAGGLSLRHVPLLPQRRQQQVQQERLGNESQAAAPSAVRATSGAAGAPRTPGSNQRTLFALDLGCNLLALALKEGAVALAGRVWASLELLGFGAEEVLLHAAGTLGELPLLHAAVVSGSAPAVSLVLSWYAAAVLPEPWLQPIRLTGVPAVLTPLILASAASPSGDLLMYILRNHGQALAAWRAPVNGASGRSAAVAAGMFRVVIAADVWAALAPAAAATTVLRRWFRRSWPLASAPAGASSRAPRRAGGGGAAAVAAAVEPSVTQGSAEELAPQRGSRAARFAVAQLWRGRLPVAKGGAPTVPTPVAPLVGKGSSTGEGPDLDVFIAQRTRAHMVAFQVLVIAFQILAQLKALAHAFDVACPSAAAASAATARGPGSGAWPWLSTARSASRCVVGRFWWTALEAAVLLALASHRWLSSHAASCAALAMLRCAFQGGEGTLLPHYGMKAHGSQMLVANLLFVVITAWFSQAPEQLDFWLRLAEGAAASRMYIRYGVTNNAGLALLMSGPMNMFGWVLSAALRRRAARALRAQQRQQHGGNLQPSAPGPSAAQQLSSRGKALGDGPGAAWASKRGVKC